VSIRYSLTCDQAYSWGQVSLTPGSRTSVLDRTSIDPIDARTGASWLACSSVRLVDGIANRVEYLQRRRTIQRFHRLYYDSGWQTWKNTRWLNVSAYKTPLDLWIYQELIVSLKPQLIVETGTAAGGSALFLATICDAVGSGEIVSIDSESRAGRPTHE